MVRSKNIAVVLSFLSLMLFTISTTAQKPLDGSESQRLDVMRDKLDRMKRSLGAAAAGLKDENKGEKSKKNDKENLDTPLGRILSLEKESGRLLSDVNNLKGKVDRGEKHEKSEVDSLEQAVSELQARVEKVQMDTATARANPDSRVGQAREVKKKKKFLGIFGGGGGNDEYDELMGNVIPGRDRELFIVATREVRKRNYDVGRLLFQTIITTYPDSQYLPMSKLAVADSFFLEGSTSALIQAIAAYQDWLTFFPTHPLADRVVLKIAEAEMRQIGLPDRDATRAKRAETRLKALLQQYPNSILRTEAQTRLNEVQDNLGLHNLYIANYYYILSVEQKKGGLKGAQSRYREILEKYPNFKFMDEVLFKIAVTYQLEEETDQAARYYQNIVSDFPNSDYVGKAKEQLELIGATIPATNPERASVLPPEDVSFFKNFRNQFFGVYPMTIDKNGVLMTKDFEKETFELIDQIIENQGDILVNQIPKALTTVISQRQPAPQAPPPTAVPVATPQK
ncbi:MAG: outer membrane protein assembly factor BamD [Pyrinomonadaceae bacterium]|nr:outer membrane protein assembly factor BamD [Pyrinomonadaceae bacterium]